MSGGEGLKSPRLSVVIACTHSSRELEPVLSALRNQEGADSVEVIVADGSGDMAVDHA